MRQIVTRCAKLASGEMFPVLGQGTWRLGERLDHRAEEIDALRLGIDLGMTLIDTAEMYGDGAAEQLVADAVADRRAAVFLVSKGLPAMRSRNDEHDLLPKQRKLRAPLSRG